jgi:N-acetylglucosaminyl-diphospho-decaprenol L-rhamnosyltransferase
MEFSMKTLTLDLSIIIVNWNTRQLLLDTISSIYANPPDPYTFEIIVVDNASSDGSLTALAENYPEVKPIANPNNRGFGPANNQGLAIAQGRYSLLLNSDVIVQPGNLTQVTAFMEAHPRVGLCGIQILNPDGSFQGSYAPYLNLWRELLILSGLGRKLLKRPYPSYGAAQSQANRPVQTIQGAFMFARTAALFEIGGLDEQFFMYGEENDLSLRLKRHGWQVYYLAEVKIIHLGGQSTRRNWTKMTWQLQKSKVLLFRKHNGPTTALGLKLLVSAAVLLKLGLVQVRQTGQWLLNSGQANSVQANNQGWFNWTEFRQFWKV